MNELTNQQNQLTTEDVMIHTLQELKKIKESQSVLSADVDYLKNEQPVNPSICLALEKMRKKKVVELLGGKDSQAYKDRKFAQSVFSQAAKDFKEYFRIPRYDLLKRKDEEQAFDYWESWQPSANTKLEIKARNGQMSLVG
jgi:prophage lambdaSa2, antirepressor protein, putative